MNCRPTGPTNAKIMIVGEAPGENEVAAGIPFVGQSGQELTRMLAEAGIDRNQCFLTNVARERPRGNDIGDFIAFRKKDVTIAHRLLRDKHVKPCVIEGYELLKREIELVRPNLIIAVGNVSMWALTGKWGIKEWRGSELHTDQIFCEDGWRPTVIPTYHPAAILRQWNWRPIALHDFRKAKRMAEKKERFPFEIKAEIEPTFKIAFERLQWIWNQLQLQPTWLSVDIETHAWNIECVGFAWSKTEAICVPLMMPAPRHDYWSEEEEFTLVCLMIQILTHPNLKLIGQNFSYDAQYFVRHWGILPIIAHDTLIGHHSMFSNLAGFDKKTKEGEAKGSGAKNLGFLSSMYSAHHVYWKDDGKTWGDRQRWQYNCEDCCRTFEVAEEELKTIEKMGVQHVNDFQQSLFGPVERAVRRGVKVDQKRRGELAVELSEEIAKRERWLIEVCGHPLNPRSSVQMHKFFVGDMKQKPVLQRRSNGTYTPSFDDECLQKMCAREPLLKPIVDVIADIRSLGIFFSTFVGADLDWDGRMRCTYNIGGTKTYRFSSNQTPFGVGTNLQNLSSGDKE